MVGLHVEYLPLFSDFKNWNIARNCSDHLIYKNKKISVGGDALLHTDRWTDSRHLEIMCFSF